MDLHSETDLSERCVPVGRQFGLLCVKHCLSSSNIIRFIVAPKIWIIAKCSLQENILRKLTLQPWTNFKHILLTLLTTQNNSIPQSNWELQGETLLTLLKILNFKDGRRHNNNIPFLRKSLVRDTKTTSRIDHLMIARSQALRPLTLKKHLTW